MSSTRQGSGKAPIFSDAECKLIAARYDGRSQAVDALLRQFAARGVKRHNIIAAAKRGGYRSSKNRKGWTAQEDAWLREHWHRKSAQEVATHLGRSVTSVVLRKKRIGIGRYDGPDLTIRDIESVLRVDHRWWHEFIDKGWLKAWQRNRQGSVSAITRVSIEALHRFLREHPEVIDYRNAGTYAIGILELAKLPEPPRYKQVRCESSSFTDCVKATPTGFQVHHGDVKMHDVEHRYRMESCRDLGGFRFWAPIYEMAPRCPRCGCMVSRFSSDAVHSDTLDESGTLAMLAHKLGLRFEDGEFRTEDGTGVDEVELMRYAFGTSRHPGKAARIFGRLLDRGLNVGKGKPVDPARLRPNILNYELTPLQEQDFARFLETGAISAQRWPGFGKRYLGGMALTRIAGRHMLMVNTRAMRDQWIAHFEQFATNVRIIQKRTPAHIEVTVFEPNGVERATIEIYSYATRHDFKDAQYVICLYDESHHLPSNRAYRHAFVACEFRMGQSASAWREDQRAGWINKLTGEPVGADWAPHIQSGLLRRVPVRVLLVRDREHKFRLANHLTGGKRAIVFCEALADGRQMAQRYGMTFIHSGTKQPLTVLAQHRRVAMSRVGDAGIDVPDLQVVVDLSFLGGSRAQSLQRFGRLLHSTASQEHVILMTEREYERFAKRVRILEDMGFACRLEHAPEIEEPGRNRVIGDPAKNWSVLFGRSLAA